MAWIKTHSTLAPNLEPTQIWNLWSDINKRHLWDLDTEWAKINGPFEKGAIIQFKPKGGPKLSMEITECSPNRSFTDCFKIPLARLYGLHEMEPTPEGLRISCTIRIEGPLGWALRKIIGEKIVAELLEQTEMLIKLASQVT